MIVDPTRDIEMRRQELLFEAKHQRLVTLAADARGHSHTPLRRELALACHRLADWLDDPKRYLQPAESGQVGWARVR